MAGSPKRHCWECLRQHLVCDFGFPSCKRCARSGVACPGYGEKPPVRLRWVPPGKVKSRNAKQPANKPPDDERAHLALVSSPSQALPSLVRGIQIHVLVEATEYYNACIYPALSRLNDLAPNSSVYLISPAMFQNGLTHPDYIRLVIVCMSLSHRMNRQESSSTTALLPDFLHYRGLMIHSLMHEISSEADHPPEYIVAGMLTLLLVDAHQGKCSNWRPHIHAISQTIHLRGGIVEFAGSKGVEPLLVCVAISMVLANTTSPASEIARNPQYLKEIDYILSKSPGDTFASSWPTSLFIQIVQINRLRAETYRPEAKRATHSYGLEVEILRRIQTFSPPIWGGGKESAHATWTLLADIYRDSVTLYCLLSMRDLARTSQLKARVESRFELAERLSKKLQKALALASMQRYMLWPLIVLGVAAATSSSALRAFVDEELRRMARFTGTHAPIAASDVLTAAWKLGKTTWDGCFDQSYMFATQMAIDVSQLK